MQCFLDLSVNCIQILLKARPEIHYAAQMKQHSARLNMGTFQFGEDYDTL
jgi:hypothetical protein